MPKKSTSKKIIGGDNGHFTLNVALSSHKPLEEIKKIFNENSEELLNKEEFIIGHYYFQSLYDYKIFEFLLEKYNNKMTEEMLMGLLIPIVMNLNDSHPEHNIKIQPLLNRFGTLLSDASKTQLIQFVTYIPDSNYSQSSKLFAISSFAHLNTKTVGGKKRLVKK